ncbi:DUF2782 domain-containing protein [Chromobacterium phragmitis]|uniref:DUF2782 domain-containing protein n=1 Tax=Chromobacterium phragmitis TaxID=2202141 RepID=A0A344UHL6_9NEIS|nr:DUF2782 domain-containing protein [Chromobacterium phragmitis]AXE29391.1 DUF2782 domain-containing protein [Chromobacterium phragmitis]AXE34764.1 DUF2782 domain-containing protein [Chromobacterium phragmitis]
MRRLSLLLLLLPLTPALAAESPAAPPKAVVPPPPTISPSNAAEPEPEVRLIQKGDEKIEEYRLNGQLYMVKVTPSHGVPYYLIDDNGSGTMRQIDPATRIVVPRWVLVRF